MAPPMEPRWADPADWLLSYCSWCTPDPGDWWGRRGLDSYLELSVSIGISRSDQKPLPTRSLQIRRQSRLAGSSLRHILFAFPLHLWPDRPLVQSEGNRGGNLDLAALHVSGANQAGVCRDKGSFIPSWSQGSNLRASHGAHQAGAFNDSDIASTRAFSAG